MMKKSVMAIAFLAVVLCLTLTMFSACGEAVKLSDTTWIPSTANNASGDEVDIREVYRTHYSNYQGSLTFSTNGTFELWLSPGDPSDGSHTGTYVLADDKINVVFDDDTQSQFDIVTKGNTQYIVVTYSDYDVCFIKQ